MGDKATPRDRVMEALSHRQPTRVPFAWGFGPTYEMGIELAKYLAKQGLNWQRLYMETGDIINVDPRCTRDDVRDNNGSATDIWGVRRKPVSYAAGVYHEFDHFPLAGAESISELEKYPWPDPMAYDYDSFEVNLRRIDPEHRKARRISGGNPFEIYCWMTGLEEAMVNLLTKPELVIAALDYITKFMEDKLRFALQRFGREVDLVFLADDLGGQHGLLISRALYRSIIKPFHMRLTTLIKEVAPHPRSLFHSDGSVFDILPELIDAGVDCLEAVQVDAANMEPEKLKDAYGHLISFHGAVSVQKLLPFADVETVTKECLRTVDVLGAGGGYIAAPTHAIQVGTPPENVVAMLKAILGEKDYQTAADRSTVGS